MRSVLFCLFSGILGEIGAQQLSDLRRCADQDCNAILSIGRTLVHYTGKEPGMVSFAPNREVKVFSKEAGSNPDLWGVVVDGRRGYANKKHIQEQRVIQANKDINKIVPIEPFLRPQNQQQQVPNPSGVNQGPLSPSPPPSGHLPPPVPNTHLPQATRTHIPSAGHRTHLPSNPAPSKASNFEVIDGTTLYLDPGLPAINESPPTENITPSEIQPTVTGQQAAGSPTAAAGSTAVAGNGEIEPSVPGETPEIQSSVRSPDFQDLEETPRSADGEAVLTGNTAGGPAPTQPDGGQQPVPVDATDPAKGEVVKDMPRTATPPDLKQQPPVADSPADPLLADSGSSDAQLPPQVISKSESPMEVAVEENKEPVVDSTNDVTQQSSDNPVNNESPVVKEAVKDEQPSSEPVSETPEEPFVDDGRDDDEEDEEEVADYDNYDDYDDEFHATLDDLNDILDKRPESESKKDEDKTNVDHNENPDVEKVEDRVDVNVETVQDMNKDLEIPAPEELNSDPSVEIDKSAEQIDSGDQSGNTESELPENPVSESPISNPVEEAPEIDTQDATTKSDIQEEPSNAQEPPIADASLDASPSDTLDAEDQNEQPVTEPPVSEQSQDKADVGTDNAPNIAATETVEAESPGLFSSWFGSDPAPTNYTPDSEQEAPSMAADGSSEGNVVDGQPPDTPTPSLDESVILPVDPGQEQVDDAHNVEVDNDNNQAVEDHQSDSTSGDAHAETLNEYRIDEGNLMQDSVAQDPTSLPPVGSVPDFDASSYPVPENPYKDGQPDLLSNNIGFTPPPFDDATPQPVDDVNTPAAEDFTAQPTDNSADEFDQVKQSADAYAQSTEVLTSQARELDAHQQMAETQGEEGEVYQQPADLYQQPADSYQQPASSYQQPADAYQQPADSYQQPADPYQQPADAYQQSTETFQQPMNSYQQPAADSYQQSAVDSYQQPADPYQQPADPYQQPADPYQQPADSYQQPADPYQQPADPATENYQQSPGMDQASESSEPFSGSDRISREHADSPMTEYLMGYMPEWLHEAAHEAGGINGDRAVLLVIVAFTLVLVNIVNSCISRGSREKPLLAKVAELDRKLFQSSNELLLLKKEASERGSSSEDTVSSAQVRELEIQLEQANLEKDRLENHTREIQTRCGQFQEEIYRAVAIQQEKEKEAEVAAQEKEAALEEARQAQEMVEEMISSQNNNQPDVKLIELVQKLQKQLESQQDVLKQYEPKLKKKEKEAKELTKEMKQLRADKANAELARDKMEKQVEEVNKVMQEKEKILEDKVKNEEEWQSLSDLLQKQLDEKSEESNKLETEASNMKSRLSIYQNELDDKEEQLEVLQETINQLKKSKGKKSDGATSGEGDGWDVEGEDGEGGWDVEDDLEVEGQDEDDEEGGGDVDVAEVARLKVAARRANTAAKKLTDEVEEIKKNLSDAQTKLDEREVECDQLRSARDQTVTDLVETNRKLEVLEQFFNKKEAELQKQLGLQSARFGDVSSSADTTAKQLASVNEELDTTKSAMKVLKCELEEQEKSLKAAVAVQEKKAHENWVAARQAERKLNDLQTEIGTLRNRLTVTESRAQSLEQEKVDLQTTIQTIQQGKHEGVNGTGSTTGAATSDHAGSETNSVSAAAAADPASLPPLPGLPASSLPPLPGLVGGMSALPTMMVPPTFLPPPLIDTRPPTLGRISPPRDRERSDNSFRSGGRGGGDYSPVRGGRDYSPSSRSERRGGGGRRAGSPPMRRPSPTRSDRGYYRDRDSSTDRSYRLDDRYDRRSARDDDYDRYYDNPPARRGPRNDDDYHRRDSRDYADTSRSDDFYDGGSRRGRDYLDLKPGPKTSSPLEPQPRKFVA